MRTAILRWIDSARRAISPGNKIQPGQYHGYSLISPVLSGIVVTPQTALAMTSVYAATNVISTDVARLPRVVYKALRKGGKRAAINDSRYRLIGVAPNEEMNSFRFWQHAMSHVLLWGNHYSEIVLDGSGMPTALWPLDPSTIEPLRDKDTNRLFYKDKNTGKRYLPEQILHLAGLGFDGIMGYSPITMARQAVGLGIGAEQFGASLFGNGAIPKGYLSTPKKMSEPAAKLLRETWENVHGGTYNANRLAILTEGLAWNTTSINPDDAQFLATREFQVIEIARMFNLPPNKLQDYSHAHLANVEESNLDYLSGTLMGWLTSIEAEVNRKLFFAEESGRVWCQHDLQALMRGNMTARGTYYKTLLACGAISPNEIRDHENMNPIDPAEGGDKYLVQAQMVPLASAGEAMAAKSGAAPKSDQQSPDEAPDSLAGAGDAEQITGN